jgi:hypothetical protein
MDAERAGLQSMSFNIYSKIAEFLTAKDLAHMEQVNKKMNFFSRQDLIWQHLFERAYLPRNLVLYATQNREKCIEGFKQDQMRLRGNPISEEERDLIIGRNHIIFDEYLASILDIPLISLNLFAKIQCFFPQTPETLE